MPEGKQTVGIQNPQGWVTAVACHPTVIVSPLGAMGQISIYSGITGKEIKKLTGHSDWIRSWFGLQMAGIWPVPAMIRPFLFGIENGQILRTLAGDDSVVTAVEWSHADAIWQGHHNGTVHIWDEQRASPLHLSRPKDGPANSSWSPGRSAGHHRVQFGYYPWRNALKSCQDLA